MLNAHPEAFTNLGLIRLEQGNTIEAGKYFARSLQLKPSVKDFINTRVAEIKQR